ncbi:MAG: restriction endonuclease subunit S [Ruminococcus sp.]|nr:restriction endonuclease subunit S [Ruminococcus sp.]
MKWETVKLSDISASIQTGPFGSQLHQSDYSEQGTPVIMPKDLLNGHISELSIARVSQNHVDRLSRHKVEVGDILYSRRGDVGRCAFATEKEQGWLCGTGCLRVTIDTEKAVPKFIFYQLQKPETVGWVEKHAVGATMLNLNTSILSDVPIEVPCLDIQKRIVDILSAYDNFIENNQKQIKLLEEAAQRLYKEWFVDLRFPGHENVKIVDGVPEGWSESIIGEIVCYYDKKRKPLSAMQRSVFQGEYRYYGAAGILDHVKEYLFDGTYLLFGEDGTVITSDGYPVLQYVSGKFWVNNHAHVLTGKEPISTEFLYMMFKNMGISDVVTGVAQPKISQARLSNKKVIIPTDSLIINYQNTVKPIFDMILNIENQIQYATEARDRLLPKLMSGEIEV